MFISKRQYFIHDISRSRFITKSNNDNKHLQHQFVQTRLHLIALSLPVIPTGKIL